MGHGQQFLVSFAKKKKNPITTFQLILIEVIQGETRP